MPNIKNTLLTASNIQLQKQTKNKLKDYIDREGKAKKVPIYSAFDKSFLIIFIDSKQLLSTQLTSNLTKD